MTKFERYREGHREELNEKARKRSHDFPEAIKAIQRKHYLKYRAEKIAYSKSYNAKHPEEHKAHKKVSATKRRPFHRARARAVNKLWKKSQSPGAIRYKLRSAIWRRMYRLIFKGFKSAPTVALLGCSVESFKIYLESKFETGMTWENYGKRWHIDHIMPCAIFDLTKPEHQRRCFHFSNMQPLFAEDNLAKGSKVLTNQFQPNPANVTEVKT